MTAHYTGHGHPLTRDRQTATSHGKYVNFSGVCVCVCVCMCVYVCASVTVDSSTIKSEMFIQRVSKIMTRFKIIISNNENVLQLQNKLQTIK